MRGSDLSFRIALLVHGWHRTGLTVLDAAERTAEYEFVKSRLGKSRRGRRSAWGDGITEVDETVRTIYYKFRHTRPNLDPLLEAWFGSYLNWCDWTLCCDRGTLDFVVKQYHERGEPENAEQFLSLVSTIRQRAAQQRASPSDIAEWFEEHERIHKTRIATAEEYLDPAEGRSSELPPRDISAAAWDRLIAAKMCTRKSDVAMATVNLARLYHAHYKFEAAKACYQRAYVLYEAALVPEQLHQVMLPWISAQIGNCEEAKGLEAPPVIHVPQWTNRSGTSSYQATE